MILNIKKINKPIVRYLFAAPFSAFLAIVIPTSIIKIFDVEKDIAFYYALVLLFFINFFISYRFVFKQNDKIKIKIIKYTFAAVIFRTLDAAWYNLYSSYIEINYQLLIFISIGTTFIIKFFIYKFFVFN